MLNPPASPAAVNEAPKVNTAHLGAGGVREDMAHFDPLLDAVLELCRLLGVPTTRSALISGMPLVDGRLGLQGAQRALERLGLVAKVQRLSLEHLDQAALPCVIMGHDGKALVLTSMDHSKRSAIVLLAETGAAEIELRWTDLEARSSGLMLFARSAALRASTQEPDNQVKRSGHWFWGALARQRLVYRDVLWAAFLINVFALAFPLFSMNVYDRVVPNHALETLWALALGVMLVLSMDLLMRHLRGRFVDEASARIDVEISAAMMERVLGLRLEHRPSSVGSFAANMRGFEQVRDFIAASTVTTLIDLPFAILFLLILVWISPWLALPVALAFGVLLVVGYIVQHRLHLLATSTHEASAQRSSLLVEALGGLDTIKTQGAEGVFQSRWETTNRYLARLGVRMRSLSGGAQFWTAWLQQMVAVLMVVIGVYLIKERELTMGALIAATMLATRALNPSGQLVGLLMQYQGARTAMESLDRIMDTPQERASGSSPVQRPHLSGAIEFRDVSFQYPGRDDKALSGIHIKIASGERVALIGKVGSGKSTLQRLIMGLYQPTEGAILLDGVDQRQMDPADVRRNMAYVPQEVSLFQGSMRENISLGLPHATDAMVVHAAEVAGLGEFVNRHPHGFGLQVGERGERLSGGQRQCVGIARAVMHQAPILLLDEPTSAMDFPTEAQVTARLDAFAKGKTVVLVTHRTSMLQWATRVIVMDQGVVIADGPKESVMEALQSGRVARAA